MRLNETNRSKRNKLRTFTGCLGNIPFGGVETNVRAGTYVKSLSSERGSGGVRGVCQGVPGDPPPVRERCQAPALPKGSAGGG